MYEAWVRKLRVCSLSTGAEGKTIRATPQYRLPGGWPLTNLVRGARVYAWHCGDPTNRSRAPVCRGWWVFPGHSRQTYATLSQFTMSLARRTGYAVFAASTSAGGPGRPGASDGDDRGPTPGDGRNHRARHFSSVGGTAAASSPRLVERFCGRRLAAGRDGAAEPVRHVMGDTALHTRAGST